MHFSLSKSSYSPAFARYLPHDPTLIDQDHLLANFDPFIPPMALTSLDTNGLSPINDHSPKTSSLNNHKRSLDSSEQNLNKRRNIKSIPSNHLRYLSYGILLRLAIVIQRNYCVSYPKNIPRCIDCQTANPSDFSLHLAGCRFQHCRT